LGKQLRGVIVAAATQLNTEVGWSALTMARLAERVGVSRQTVYNEVGSKALLAELIRQRAARQLGTIIDEAFAAHPTDVVAGVRSAAFDFLQAVEIDPMLKAILASSQGVPSDLLPSPDVDASYLLGRARDSLRNNLERFELTLTPDQRSIFIETAIRLVLSKALQPSSSPQQAADGIAWVTSRVLGIVEQRI
jgi:AcrR family transcriptional regulator